MARHLEPPIPLGRTDLNATGWRPTNALERQLVELPSG